MEYSERVLCGTGEVEPDPNIVSEEAGKLYSELQTVVETHGEGVVESLVPTFVWVLEGLAACRAQLREREEEAERERAEREELLERYQAERARRKESQERFLELEDQTEQERRTMRSRETERERRARELEKKAREQADQLVALEEQKSLVVRELSSLKHSHYKLSLSYHELLEERSPAESEAPHRSLVRPVNADAAVRLVSEPGENEKGGQRSLSLSARPGVEDYFVPEGQKSVAVAVPSPSGGGEGFVNDIIGSTPELAQFQRANQTSTPGGRNAEEALESSGEEQTESCPEEKGEKEGWSGGEREEEEEEEEEEEDSVEWELRNTDSVFSELSELSRDYVESVDRGAGVRGSADRLEEVLAHFEELKANNESLEAARKSLISRVVELTDDRAALKQEVTSLQETNTHLEGRAREREEENRRIRNELETFRSEDPDASLPSSARSFSRSEMARVVMEKNQYKQRLLELQEAVRHSQTLRASKEEKLTEEKRSSVWRKFNRLFGLTKPPLAPPSAAALSSSSPSLARSSLAPSPLPNQTQAERGGGVSCRCAALSSRFRRKEVYREIRGLLWASLGKRQHHGWSVPLGSAQENNEPVAEPKDVPVLVRLRLLDHRDSTAKLNCAVAVPPEVSGDATCAVWVVSGPASCSDITVIDPARSNAVLDQFSLPPTGPALCLCAVPPIGDSAGSVWIGTQEGSIQVHPAAADRRRRLHAVHLAEGVHSLTYVHGRVVAGLSDGTLAFFSHTSGGWSLQSPAIVAVGSNPLQPVRCCLAKGQRLWVGYWNRVHVVHVDDQRVERSFPVSERSEQQVRFLCGGGSGVWTACRLDPVLRLFDWSEGRLLQEVNFAALVTKTLGQPFLSLSPLQISSLSIIATRLWVGTGGGAIFSLPLSITSEAVSIPYCSASSAQLCYHGHRQTVRFIIAASGCLITSPGSSLVQTAQLVLSGGEGYINFRIGDDASDDSSSESSPSSPQRSDRSHMIIWQNPSPPAAPTPP